MRPNPTTDAQSAIKLNAALKKMENPITKQFDHNAFKRVIDQMGLSIPNS